MSSAQFKSEFKEPQIKGAVVRPAREWVIKTFGQELYDQALQAIRREHASVFEAEIVSVGWYPLAAWSALMNAIRREVKSQHGIEWADFDRRNVFEAGSQTLTKVYRLVFGLMSPITVIEKLMPVASRVYSHGEATVISHTEGHLVLAFKDAPVSMLEEIKRMFPLSAELMLHLAGQQVTEMRSIVETHEGRFQLKLNITYTKQRK